MESVGIVRNVVTREPIAENVSKISPLQLVQRPR